MPRSFAETLKVICALLALALALPVAAQPKPSPLIGVSREQILGRYGEPKSQLRAGQREILFYPKLKLSLRNDVVVETEEVDEESAPRRPTETPAASAPKTSESA